MAYSGTESGGGGGVVWINSRPVLTDYFTMVDSISEIPIGNIENSSVSDVKSTKAFLESKKILNNWSKFFLDTMPVTVKLAMDSNLRWEFVDTELKAYSFFLEPTIPADNKIEAVAYYHFHSASNVSVKINRSIWDQMDLLGQTGLVIHETLRQVQVGWRHGFDDQALQRATAIYLMCQPTNRLNYYMFYVLNNSPEMADKVYGSFKNFVKHECRRIK